jgi:hypothetical protein
MSRDHDGAAVGCFLSGPAARGLLSIERWNRWIARGAQTAMIAAQAMSV